MAPDAELGMDTIPDPEFGIHDPTHTQRPPDHGHEATVPAEQLTFIVTEEPERKTMTSLEKFMLDLSIGANPNQNPTALQESFPHPVESAHLTGADRREIGRIEGENRASEASIPAQPEKTALIIQGFKVRREIANLQHDRAADAQWGRTSSGARDAKMIWIATRSHGLGGAIKRYPVR